MIDKQDDHIEVRFCDLEKWGGLIAECHGAMKAEAKAGNWLAERQARRLRQAYIEIANILDARAALSAAGGGNGE